MQSLSHKAFIAPMLLACVCMVIGCTPRSTRPDALVVRITGEGQIAKILDYVDNVLSLPPAAQISARESLANQFKLTQFPDDRMRLALLDILLPAPAEHTDQAAALLAGYNWEAAGPGFKGLAALILNIINTRQIGAKNNQLLMQQLAGERAQRAHLQQQLDALKNIEKTMNKHDKPVTPPMPATTRVPATPPEE
ncbi:MAG: hypothetical protein WCC11_02795 [Gammaproteobacteria bacterium]